MIELLVFEHQKYEHPGNIKKIAQELGVNLTTIPLWSPTFHAGSLPTIWPLDGIDGLLIMGGSMGVSDNEQDFPSKTMELRTIQAAYGRVPVIGICLGSQLIAKTLGAEVYQNKVDGRIAKEIGYYRVDITADGLRDPLYKGIESPLLVLQWHGDAFTLPKGATRLAFSPLCENQAFVLRDTKGRLLYYAQLFHLEPTVGMLPVWIKKNSEWMHAGFRINDEKLIEQSIESDKTLREESAAFWENLVAELEEQARAR